MRAEAGQSGADRQRLRDGLSSLSICLPAYFILIYFLLYSPPCYWQMYMEEWGQQKLHDMKEKILKHEIYIYIKFSFCWHDSRAVRCSPGQQIKTICIIFFKTLSQ